MGPPPPDDDFDGGGGGGPHLPHGGPPASRQQARVRRIAFLLGAIVVLILIVIAFRGCLNARSDRAFENYVSDLSSITAETQPLSQGFFDLLGGNADEAAVDIGLQNQVAGDVSTSQGLLDRAEGLDAPDEVEAGQEQIVLAFELRHDALAGIAAQLDRTNSDNSGEATAAIYTQMKVLSASDILYARGKDQIEQALVDQEIVIEEGVPDSQFLPDEPNYLIPEETESAISGAAGTSGGGASDADCKDDGLIHGVGLVDGGSTLQPSGTALVDGGSVTAAADDDSIEVSVQNQGEADESDIDVTVSGDGVDGSDTIGQLTAGETGSATIPLRSPGAGSTVEITVDVATVGCEQVAENNTATFSVTF